MVSVAATRYLGAIAWGARLCSHAAPAQDGGETKILVLLGGSWGIPATLAPNGDIVQLSPLHRIVLGRLPESSESADDKLQELLRLFRATPVDAKLAPDMWLEFWEKFAGQAKAVFRALLRQRGSTLTASILRDIEAGARTEGAHIVVRHAAPRAGAGPGPAARRAAGRRAS